MKENRIMEQVNAIFSIFMVIFYLGMGIYLLFFFKNGFGRYSDINNAAVSLIGGTFLLFGIYRAYSTFVKILKAFFKHDDSGE